MFSASADDGIKFFKGSFDDAKALAKKEGKVIFMDAYTTWCGPCKMMTSKVFPQKEVGDFYNRNFINIKVDMEKGEGLEIRRQYKVSAYPTLLFIDHTGEVVYETRGARDAKGLIALGKKALLPDQSALVELTEKWNSGEREAGFIQEYIKTRAALGEDYEEAFESLMNTWSIEDKLEVKNAAFIKDHTKGINSPGVAFMLEYADYYNETFDEGVLTQALANIAKNAASEATLSKDLGALKEVASFLKKNKIGSYDEDGALMMATYYGKTEDWANYDKYITKYIKKYKSDDDEALREVAWNYYMKFDDVKKLSKAEQWASDAVELNNSYENHLTESYLLYKLGDYSAAQDAVEYALILAGEEGSKKTKNAKILKEQIYEKLEK